VIVDDLNIEAMTSTPYETNAPLIVDANRVLSLTIAAQSFQLVSRRRSQHTQLCRSVQLKQLSQSDALKCSKAPAVLVAEEIFCLF
jgi:hypothetical protein